LISAFQIVDINNCERITQSKHVYIVPYFANESTSAGPDCYCNQQYGNWLSNL